MLLSASGRVSEPYGLIADASAVLEAAQAVLPPARIRELHAKPAQRAEELISAAMTKLGVSSRHAAAHRAWEAGWI